PVFRFWWRTPGRGQRRWTRSTIVHRGVIGRRRGAATRPGWPAAGRVPPRPARSTIWTLVRRPIVLIVGRTTVSIVGRIAVLIAGRTTVPIGQRTTVLRVPRSAVLVVGRIAV